MRIMGLDFGEKRVGVALSDSLGILASALTVIERNRKSDLMEQINALVSEHEVELIVVGLPQSLDGSIGPQAQRVRDFIEMLSKIVEIPVVEWDERFSTADAERVLVEAGTKRDRRKKHRDAVAAAFILQGYLDRAGK